MEIHTTTTDKNPNRQAAVSALAVVGFIVLILVGIALAIYAARFVPVALNRLGTGAVSLSSVFSPSDDAEPELAVVETSIPFEPVATSSDLVIGGDSVVSGGSYTPGEDTYTPAPAPVVPTYGAPRTITVPVTVPAPGPYGRADLTVDITEIGYCSSDRTSSFRRSSDVPDGENGGFRFAVRNIGTNVSGTWDFTYELPTSPSLERTVRSQRSLGPGDRIDYTICFTEPRAGNNRTITVEVDTGRDVTESNENNNSDSARIDIDD